MRKMLVFIGIGLLALLLVITLAKTVSQHSQHAAIKSVSDRFVQDTLSNKSVESYALFTSTAQSGITSQDWQDRVAQMSLFFTARKPSFAEITNDAGTETVTYNITGNDGDYRLRLLVVQQQKTWKVQSFTSSLKQ